MPSEGSDLGVVSIPASMLLDTNSKSPWACYYHDDTTTSSAPGWNRILLLRDTMLLSVAGDKELRKRTRKNSWYLAFR